MNWTHLAEVSWTNARAKQWLTALVTTRRQIYTCKITPFELSQLKGAWEMYAFIRAYKPLQARQLRSVHEYRRFYELYRLWRIHEFSAEECIEHLEFDGSIAGMVGQVIDIHHPLPEWRRKFDSMCKYGDVIFTSYDAPEDVRAWAGEGKKLMEKYK